MRVAAAAVLPFVVGMLSSSCGGSAPASPSSVPSPNASAPRLPGPSGVSGRTVDVLSEAGAAGIRIQPDGGAAVSSDADGYFSLPSSSSLYRLTLTGPEFVTRETAVTASATQTTVSLIPNRFDLSSFNEMFSRASALHRWLQPPRLVVERAVLTLTSVNDDTFLARDEQLSASEVSDLIDDLRWGLPQMTGNSFADFSAIDLQTSASGSMVNVKRTGAVFVARYEGLQDATTYWGYGRWAWDERDAIVAGIMFLDRAFEQSGSPFRRSLRSHELGHALGYSHVTLRASVMNSSGRVTPNQFDREATLIAFKRPPGNQVPDRDPSWYTLGLTLRSSDFGVTWGPPVPEAIEPAWRPRRLGPTRTP